MKKQTAGSGITFVAFVLSIVAIIVYNVNINSAGYFENATVPEAVMYNVLGIVFLAVILVMSQLSLKGAVDKVLTIVSDALRIGTPVFFIAALMKLLSSRVQGFAFIYFSNEEVLHEVQTAENMSSAHGTIANIVLLGVTAVVAMIAAFFSMKKTQKAQ